MCVDSALNADKRNGQSSIGCIAIVDNTLVVINSRIQTFAEKSIYRSKFIFCEDVVEKVLGFRELVRLLRCRVVELSRIFYNNRVS